MRTSGEPPDRAEDELLDIVYVDDFEDKLMSTFESLAVAAGESRQHQSYAETLGAFAAVLDRLPDGHGERARDVILRTLPQVSEHAPTRALQRAFQEVGDALERHGDDEAADQVRRHGVEEVAVTDADPRRGERATTDQTP